MNENDVIASLSLSRVLIGIIESQGKITVDVEKILKSEIDDKELVVDYNEEDLTFTFSVRG